MSRRCHRVCYESLSSGDVVDGAVNGRTSWWLSASHRNQSVRQMRNRTTRLWHPNIADLLSDLEG